MTAFSLLYPVFIYRQETNPHPPLNHAPPSRTGGGPSRRGDHHGPPAGRRAAAAHPQSPRQGRNHGHAHAGAAALHEHADPSRAAAFLRDAPAQSGADYSGEEGGEVKDLLAWFRESFCWCNEMTGLFVSECFASHMATDQVVIIVVCD